MKNILLLFSLTLLVACSDREVELVSPSFSLLTEIAFEPTSGELTYNLATFGKEMLLPSRLGYVLANGDTIPGRDWEITNVSKRSVDTVWKPIWGKRREVADRFNEVTVLLAAPASSSLPIQQLEVQLRMYDDGLAFRYRLPTDGEAKAASELTSYNFAGNYTSWFYNGENHNIGPLTLSEVKGVQRPVATIKAGDNQYLALHEADLMEGDPLLLRSTEGSTTFSVASSPGAFGVLRGGFTSAWRVVFAAQTPGGMVDSHLIELLNPEHTGDFSWVKPTVAVWDWRIDGAVWDGFTYAMNYPSWVRMIDFAAEQGFGALVLDANWYGPEHEAASDPIKGNKASDVQRIVAYGKEKGVGVWLYLNDVGGRKFPIEETLKQYGDWGAEGVKYGFMKGSQESKNHWTRKITELCAENRLLVNYHDDPVHPYGQMRTFPNAVTREFCHAQLDGHHVFVPKTFVTTVFVNMLAGPIDMNNGMFDLRQGNTTRVDENQPVPSTLVAEAARTLITFSGVTILPDIPEYYRKYPDLLAFLRAQKMPWVESRTLSGTIGESIVMMRQTDEAYLVAAATDEEGRSVDVSLNFLPEGTYEAHIVEDGEGAHYLTNRETLRTSTRSVTAKDVLTLQLAPGGGACVLIHFPH